MATKKPNTKIENGKVVFSKEVLDYFEKHLNFEVIY